jgi:hypothetical protein
MSIKCISPSFYKLLSLSFVTFMHTSYNYITEANHVSRVYIVAAYLCLLFMVHVLLIPTLNVSYFYIRNVLLLLLLLLWLLLLPVSNEKEPLIVDEHGPQVCRI